MGIMVLERKVTILDKLEINSFKIDELRSLMTEFGQPAYRGQQVFRWIHKQAVNDFVAMDNLPHALLDFLEERFRITKLEEVKQRVSRDGTIKFLYQLFDNTTIESVLIPEEDRNTICVSTQVGCAMNCSFCATGKAGFVRQLTSGEISKQVEQIAKQHSPITNVVFMGMGEPLHNYEQVMTSIDLLNTADGIELGMRRFTISTCGITPKIRQLATDNDQVGLAVSLHAATDQKRISIMPIAKRYPLVDLIDACRYYSEKTRRRVTFEYALIAGFNDTLADCEALVSLLETLNCHVNLIPINPVVEQFARPQSRVIQDFAKQLENHKIPVSIRKERGTDIEAACGQLKQSRED